jgi:large subunit ribosomal protein L20
MSRVKRGVAGHARHKKILSLAKGFRSGRSRVWKLANQAVMKSGMNAYRDRRLKKRSFRKLWNTRINAAVRPMGINYSRFINALFTKQVIVNRKVLSEMAIHYPEAFETLVNQVK